MAVHRHHHGSVIRRSPQPKHQVTTNLLHAGSQSASPQLDQAPNMAVPGGVTAGQGMPAGPGSPTPDTSVQLPPGMPPVNPGR